MKSKSFSIASADFNGATPLREIDPKMVRTVNTSGHDVSQVLYPKGIQIVNTSGVDLEYVIISSAQEDEEFTLNIATPETYPFYDFILLPKDATLSESNMVTCYKFYIRKVLTNTSAALRIDFKQYI